MKLRHLFTIILAFAVLSARAQDMDSELAKLSEDLSSQITNHNSKKITVLDFTDLDGNPSEIGKYIADQLTVDFVMKKRDFSILDRAHLKRIMDEHKLTASGLVDPENAKKLGAFAGVDAMIFGKAVSVGNRLVVTVTIETTDTAEVTGGGKAKFIQDESIKQLVNSAPQTAVHPAVGYTQPPEDSAAPKPPPALGSQQIGELLITATKLIKMENGKLLLSLTLQNMSERNTMAVAIFHDPCYVHPCYLRSTIVAGDGSKFITDSGSLTGISTSRFTPDDLTQIQPGATVKATITYSVDGWNRGKLPGNIISFTWQTDLLINGNYHVSDYDNYRPNQNVMVPHCKIQNVSLEFQLPRE